MIAQAIIWHYMRRQGWRDLNDSRASNSLAALRRRIGTDGSFLQECRISCVRLSWENIVINIRCFDYA